MIGISATLGQLLMTVAFQQGDPLVSSALGYTQVIFAALLGIAIWGDSIPPRRLAGYRGHCRQRHAHPVFPDSYSYSSFKGHP